MTSVLGAMGPVHVTLLAVFAITQVLYLVSLLVSAYFFTRPVNEASTESAPVGTPPRMMLLYPVLAEDESTMQTTFLAIDRTEYPADRLRVVAIPNADDAYSLTGLHRLQAQYSWLEILEVPPTTDPSWAAVWDAWSANPKAYWWHAGKRAGQQDLPPKKTRQLDYAFYTLCPAGDPEETLVSYIDADSAPPLRYFREGAAGMEHYDVIQLTNLSGNLLSSWASSFHAADHMAWDSSMYAHMTADGKHPFYVLGKGLFFKASDLHALGGFHPWLTIEDPEVGMRLWTNGRRLGVVRDPLIEEVPLTFKQGVTQRKRWVCGFLQSLGSPLTQMGMSVPQRMRARLNFVPCLSMLMNPVGMAVGLWVLIESLRGDHPVSTGFVVLAAVNIVGAAAIMAHNWRNAWRLTALVLDNRKARLRYIARVNPLFMLAWWLWWTVSIVIGFQMFIRDRGLTWERTKKVDANHDLVRGNDLASASSSVDSLDQTRATSAR